MASAMWPNAKEKILDGAIDFNTDTIKARAVADDDYTYASTETVMTPITKYGTSTDYTLQSPTISSGVFDAADASPAYSALAADGAKSIDALVIFKFDTDDASSIPLLYIDLSSAVTPNGGDINITWDSASNKIFALNNA